MEVSLHSKCSHFVNNLTTVRALTLEYHFFIIRDSCHVESRWEVAQGIDFLQVVNTTFYTTTMGFFNNSSLENHNSHIYTFSSFFFFVKLFISSC
jgi:hypothetical protein